MAESSRAGAYHVLPAARSVDEARWSPPQTAMLVTVVSACLWALIFAAGRWLIG